MDSASQKHPLVAFREARGLSQPELAEMIGVDRATIWKWENGRKISDDYVGIVSEKIGIARRTLRPDLVALMGEAAE